MDPLRHVNGDRDVLLPQTRLRSRSPNQKRMQGTPPAGLLVPGPALDIAAFARFGRVREIDDLPAASAAVIARVPVHGLGAYDFKLAVLKRAADVIVHRPINRRQLRQLKGFLHVFRVYGHTASLPR